MSANDIDIVYKYAPVIRFDSKEPFFPVRVGYTIFTRSGKSPSFHRIIKVPPGITVIEYAIYWDWDIGHLYELEHVWIYLRSGKMVKIEASGHDKFKAMDKVTFNSTHPVLYSQPGKHAFASDPEEFEPHQKFIIPCKNLAGNRGLLITRIFEGVVKKTPEDDGSAFAYLKKFSFIPSFKFTRKFKINKDILVSWEDLYRWIPERIKWWIEKLKVTLSEEEIKRCLKNHLSATQLRGSSVFARR